MSGNHLARLLCSKRAQAGLAHGPPVGTCKSYGNSWRFCVNGAVVICNRALSFPRHPGDKVLFATGTVGGKVGGKEASGGKVAASLPLAAWRQNGGKAWRQS
eukprot:gene15943-biopygen10122